jgi:hypothetical protein
MTALGQGGRIKNLSWAIKEIPHSWLKWYIDIIEILIHF